MIYVCNRCRRSLQVWESVECESCLKAHVDEVVTRLHANTYGKPNALQEARMELYRNTKPFVRSEASLSILALTSADRDFLAQIGVACA